MSDEMIPWIRLNMAEGLGIPKKIELLSMVPDPADLFALRREELVRLGVRGEAAESLLEPKYLQEAEGIMERADKSGIRIVTLAQREYPEMLRYIHDPPLVLYVKGKIPKEVTIGIVGSRKASGYGMDAAFKLAGDLASTGCTIVSGMARGIDTAAHTGALHTGGQTIAVLGCGPDRAYPPENRGLMERIADHGAVLSEYPPGSIPAQFHFPVRNRIISGISLGVLVVEAGDKSGSLITAQSALEQGREVFAVPGNINHYNSMGTNKLIREGAKLVLTVNDILDEMPWCKANIKAHCAHSVQTLSSEEENIIRSLRLEDLYIEQISVNTGISMSSLYTVLLTLELKGLVEKDLTGRYRVCG